MPKTISGIIIKSLSGFYYVESAGAVYECRGRGVLRVKDITPTVGDHCTITVKDSGLCTVDKIHGRKNILVRPAVANLDKLFLIISSSSPKPNLLNTDRLTAACEYNGIEPILVMTKLDLGDLDNIAEIYISSGFKVLMVDYADKACLDAVKNEMRGCVSAFAGNSGVGKSTLLNAICPGLSQQTGETSKKLGRGRHTTRSVELFNLPFDGKIADTPGFSSFDNGLASKIPAEKLQYCFREFDEYLGLCRFTSCAHTVEAGCTVLAALREGKIKGSRHQSYLSMIEEARAIKQY